LLTVFIALTSIEVWQKNLLPLGLAAGVASQGVDVIAASTCGEF
jgi:hypothetical protein